MLLFARLAGVTRVADSGDRTIFYTVDGNDPMEEGSLTYNEPFVLTRTCVVKARTYDGTEWSALNEARFVVEGQPPR